MSVHTNIDSRLALSEAKESAEAAGVTVTTASTVAELAQLTDVFEEIWLRPSHRPVVPTEVLIALSHAGNYVAVTRQNDRIIGGAVGFFSHPGARMLHSHIAGIHVVARGGGVGYALKLHQRAWALAHGATRITWTYDPLVARNAHFNIERLGAAITGYHTNFYGNMEDGINALSESDRAIVEWQLLDSVGQHSPPAPGPGARVSPTHVGLSIGSDLSPIAYELSAGGKWPGQISLQVPPSIEQLRIDSPELDEPWRLALRDKMTALLAEGYRVSTFQRDQGYLFTRQP